MQDDSEQENLTQRSKRLEEQASQGMYDPLAPEPLLAPEEEEGTSFASELEVEEANKAASSEDEQNSSDNQRIQDLESELAQMKDQLLRAVAEQENTSRRSRKEREDANKYAISNFAKDLLDVSDNLRRAIDATPDDLIEQEPRLNNLVEGIKATERELMKCFEKYGIVKIEPQEEQFDPNFHEVMVEIPSAEKEPGTILQVMETGYSIHDRLLRPARVGVAKEAPPEQTQAGSENSAADKDPGSTIDTEV